MQAFLDYMREQLETYIPPPGPPGPPLPEQVNFVEGAVATSERVVTLDTEFDGAELAYIDRFRQERTIAGPAASIALILDQMEPGWRGRVTDPPKPRGADYRTDRDIVADYKRTAAAIIGAIAAKNLGPDYSKDLIGKEISIVRKKINNAFGIRSVDDITTPDVAADYCDFIREWSGE
jgi:hypothetical protein